MFDNARTTSAHNGTTRDGAIGDKHIRNGALRIALIYAIIGVLYIVISDRVLGMLFNDVETITIVGTLKGWAFIGVTALLLWYLISRHSARLLASEAKRLERESLLSSVLDNVGGYLYVKDTSYRYQYGNAAVCSLFGITAEQLVGCEDTQFLDAETAAKLRANDRRVIENGERLEAEEEHVSVQAGIKRTYLSVKMPLRRGDGSIYGLCGISTDITERKATEAERSRLQSQLVQAQKMEAIGQLTGGIAHDFNNILASVLGYTSLALEEVKTANSMELRGFLLQIKQAGERASSLVRRMLQFSRARPAEGVAAPLHVQPAIAEIITMLRPTIPSNIAMHTDMTGSAAIIRVDAVELHQLLTNLIINARDAIEGNGVITVTLRQHGVHAGCVCTVCNAPLHGEHIELSVSDTGQGIAAKSLDEVFEPFYTTKEVGKGTGLGLSVVHGIVHRLGGHILVKTQLGVGTTLSLLFPPVDEPARAISATVESMPPVAAPGNTATLAAVTKATSKTTIKTTTRVMVIDDEPALVNLIQDMLERNGYQVMAYTDSRAALQAFVTAPAAVDLVISDQTMPGLTGIELARQMLASRSDLPILLCSGFSEQLGMAKSMGVRQVLAKPVAMPELFQAIAQELA